MRAEREKALRRVAVAAGVVVIIVGGGHLLAWVTGVMARVPPSTILMKTNAGLGLLVCGLALVLLAPSPLTVRRRQLVQVLAAFVLVLGLLTLGEHVTHWNLHIDQVLATEQQGAAGTTSPNRMGPPASSSLVLLGVALLLACRPTGRRSLHEPLALIVALVGLLSLVGYAYDASELYAVARVTAIAWPTAASLLVLAVGLLCAKPGEGLMRRVTDDDPGGAIIRALIAPIVVAPLVFGWLRLAGERFGSFDAAMGAGLTMLLFIVTFSALLLFASRRVSLATEARKRADEALAQRAADQQALLAALRKSDEQFRALIENVTAGVALIDERGRFALYNRRFLVMFGLSPDTGIRNINDQDWSAWQVFDERGQLLPVDEHPVRKAAMTARAVRDRLVKVVRPGGGMPIWMLVSAEPLQGADGAVERVICTYSDVTDRRTAEQSLAEQAAELERDIAKRTHVEEALRRSEEKFAKAFHVNTAAMAIARLEDGVYIEVNDRFVDITGFGRDDTIGRTAADLRLWKDPRDRASFIRDLREHGVVRNAEYRFVRPDGQEWIGLVSSQLSELEGDAVLISSIADITEVRRAEHAQRQSEERFRALVTATSDVIYRMSPDWSEMRQLRGQNFIADTAAPDSNWVAKYIHQDDWPRVRAAIEEAIATRRAFQLEHRVLRVDGTLGWTFSRAVPVLDDSGTVVEWFGTASDITERKRMEEALREANERLREADRRKDEFLAVLSHELRNPLAPIRAALYILEHAAPGGEQANHARTVIDRQVEQLSRLVDDLLDVTRVTRGKIHLQREPVELGALVCRTAEDHRGLFAAGGVELNVVVPDDQVWVDGDAQRLAQVVGNLLHNAAKFTQAGGRTAIRVSREPAAGRAVISVRDTGVGIDPNALQHLFEPFVQVDTTLDRALGGLGLGLSLVKSLVEMHGGTVSVASHGIGQGAEFTIRLPLGTAPALADRPDTASPQPSRRIFIVEDNVDAAESLRDALELAGHEVEVAFNGVEALQAIRTFQPEVVLCDIGLPEMDGYEVARALRNDEATASAYLIALTGYALPEDVAKAHEAGFDLHVAKPPDPLKLQQALARAQPTRP